MKSERFYGGKDRVYGNYASLTRRGQTRPNIWTFFFGPNPGLPAHSINIFGPTNTVLYGLE